MGQGGLTGRLKEITARFQEIEAALADPKATQNQARYRQLTKDHAELADLVQAIRRLDELQAEIESNQELLADEDPEMRALAQSETDRLESECKIFSEKITTLLQPKDPDDDKSVVLEIRAGTGGEEASLFAADLFRMYTRFAESQKWKVEVLSGHETSSGGFKEIIAAVEGRGAFAKLKYESGVHRVQRVPATESQGRIHTSAASVAVLPEAEAVEVEIDPTDLRVDTYRSSGRGGQHVNVTDSAVRLTHLSTGIVVTCQDERSQHKNKAKAMKILRARLLDRFRAEQETEIANSRRSQVGSGDRSERIRTYNFPQGRLTDHRIGLTLYRLEEILAGEIDELISQLAAAAQAKALEGEGSDGADQNI